MKTISNFKFWDSKPKKNILKHYYHLTVFIKKKTRESVSML